MEKQKQAQHGSSSKPEGVPVTCGSAMVFSPQPSSSQTPATLPAHTGEEALNNKGSGGAAAGTPVSKTLEDELLMIADDSKVCVCVCVCVCMTLVLRVCVCVCVCVYSS